MTHQDTMNTFIPARYPALDLPPLPLITDPILLTTVFTHSSVRNDPKLYGTSVFVPRRTGASDYEKLEHVGDRILGAVLGTLMHEMYPDFKQGSAAIMYDKLASNTSLAQISVQYGLPKRIQASPDIWWIITKNEKCQASLFGVEDLRRHGDHER